MHSVSLRRSPVCARYSVLFWGKEVLRSAEEFCKREKKVGLGTLGKNG